MSDTQADQAGATYAVIGQPVKHSLSPLIHRHFASLTSQALNYDLLEAQPSDFAETVAHFFASGGDGLNVTLPFKEQAREFVQRLSPAASTAGAVNTILNVDGVLEGHNTDGAGLVQDLQGALGWRLENARVLLIGAGGASRGALAALMAQNPANLVLTNRTLERATTLVAEVAPNNSRIQVRPAAELNESFDVVINATSASLAGHGALVPTQTVRGARCYDMLYSPTQTVFCGWAQSHGAQEVADGLGMLLEQAAEAFALWRGVRPDTNDLRSKRTALFAAKQADAKTLEGFLAGSSAATGSSAEQEAVSKRSSRETKRFIAGAVCPQCREVDRIVVRVTDGVREQACIACGYVQPESDSESGPETEPTQRPSQQALIPRGKHERAPAADPTSIPSQPVRFIDPQSTDSRAETKPTESRPSKPRKAPPKEAD